MKEKNEELERNSTVSNIFQLKQENEDVQYQRQFTIRNEDMNITGSRNTGILIDQDDDREGIKLSLNLKNLIGRLQNISADNEGRHSGEWKDLYEAASQVMTFIVQKRPVGSDTGIALLLQLSEACHHYNETHIDKSGKKIDERKKNVRALRKLICDCFADEVREKLQQDDLPEEPEDIRKEEAEANVKRFSEYYVAFSSKIGKDMIGSAEEKLCRRWNALRSCEEDIRIYRLANNDDK